jgi:hypothetical protein
MHFEHVRVVSGMGEEPEEERLPAASGAGEEEGTRGTAAAAADRELNGKGTAGSTSGRGKDKTWVAWLLAAP